MKGLITPKFTMKKELYWQRVRGICILSVIGIHILAEYLLRSGGVLKLEWVLARQLLNFSVPTFVFIAGYFTKKEKVKSAKTFYFRRLQRLLVPYIIWSLLYLGLRGKLHQNILETLITGGASWHLYYIIVLLQCVMLTPMLVKFNGWGGVILSVVAFQGYMLIKYSCLWQGMKWLSFPLCVEFLPFYTLGILAGNSTERMKLKSSKISMFGIFLFAGVSFVEAAIWNNHGMQIMAMSQGKVASYCFAMSVVLFFLVRDTNINEETVIRFSNRVLIKIGNLSYGIFFVHMLFVYMIKKVWNFINFDINNGLIYCVLNFVVVVTGSYLMAFVMNKILPQKIASRLGMS